MIRIERGAEPAQLAARRRAGLQKVSAIVDDPDRTLTSDDFGGYRVAAQPMLKAQRRKCCYCEKRLQESEFEDVEHYRPKTRARRGSGLYDRGYWWLAWTWENLFLSCKICNHKKRDWFPLAEGSVPLGRGEFPPGRENPLLIDPGAGTDPFEFIAFRPFNVNGQTRWKPVGIDREGRGQETIARLALDRDGLIEAYSFFVHEYLDRPLRKFQGLLNSGDADAILREWQDLQQRFLSRHSEFAALAYAVISSKIPEPVRQRWGLELPRPPIKPSPVKPPAV